MVLKSKNGSKTEFYRNGFFGHARLDSLGRTKLGTLLLNKK